MKLKRHSGVGIGMALLSVTAACSDGSFESADPGTLEEPITGGTLVTAQEENQPYSAAARIQLSGEGTCTAMKITSGANNRYLTAAHCVENWDGREALVTHDRDGLLTDVYDVDRVWMHPSYASDPDRGNPNAAVTHSYDVAVVQLAEETPGPTLGNLATEYQTSGTTLRVIGYGCDLYTGNDGQKQKNGFIASTQAFYGADPWTYARYIVLRENSTSMGGELPNAPVNIDAGCDGDSGGPVVKVINSIWNVVGVHVSGSHNAGADGRVGTNDDVGRSAFARVGNVRRWIQSPKLNVFADGERGFLQVHTGRQCMSYDSSNRTNIAECDGRAQPTDKQYWRLILHGACGTHTCFRIQNTLNPLGAAAGTCLATSGDTGMTLQACSSAQARQRFWFGRQGTSDRHKIITSTNTCVSQSSDPATTLIRQSQCNVSGSQDWYFYP